MVRPGSSLFAPTVTLKSPEGDGKAGFKSLRAHYNRCFLVYIKLPTETCKEFKSSGFVTGQGKCDIPDPELHPRRVPHPCEPEMGFQGGSLSRSNSARKSHPSPHNFPHQVSWREAM